MDVWGVEPGEDEDLDPLALPDFSPGDAETGDDEADPLAPLVSDQQGEAEEDLSDGGVSDPYGVVRLWVEDGRLVRVRVSPIWYTKLGKRPLGENFSYALRLANATVADMARGTAHDFSDEDFSGLPQFSSVAFAAFQGVLREVHERWTAAIERHGDRVPRKAPPTFGRSQGVTVYVNGDGLADTVVFDERWLDDAHAGQIATHVQLAADEASARYVPPASDRAELDAIEEEHAYLMAAFTAMLNPRG